MNLLVVVDLIASFEEWKAVFDGDAEARSTFMTSWLVGQTDENKAMILAYGVDVPAMAAFMGTSEFAEKTGPYMSGVTIYTLSEMERPA